eukprot:CAMPEP_0113858026 /NCGR_PEP_ID=MMETSP0372-20130328/10843_1 /TAXON_ID=340204 /ORGANISM="Lankesteria abbotti" /LENGTH=100 /DNA_ID=CAMNT_0000834653 /DNA_START=29 /DNA_END=331 /DNA_ORIENTATION=+ /assembly_acc=CAM_ASM_000359
MKLVVEFFGGLEMLASGGASHELEIDAVDGKPVDVGDVVVAVRKSIIKITPDLFVTSGSRLPRPGILVLVNDCDWELLGESDAELKEGDKVTFVSTLHGG